MATIAARRSRVALTSGVLEFAPLAIGLAGLLLGWIGSAWDVAWHRALGRDTFWSPPHTAMYIGTTLVGLSALVALVTALRGRTPRTRELAIGPLHAERSFALVGFGALAIISAAPLDDLWHRLFGRDVDIWSPPHLFAVAGAVLAYAGWSSGAMTGAGGRVARSTVTAILVAGLIGTLVFGMNFYYVFAWSRDALLYPVIVCMTIPFALAVGASLLEHRFAATAVALVYTFLNLVTFVALRSLGWPPPAFAPLVVAGALALDLTRSRIRSPLAIGLAFAIAFATAEAARLVITAPVPSAAVLADQQVGRLATQYWAMASARPWLSAWPLAVVALGAPLAAVSWMLGGATTRVLTAR